MKKLLSVIMVVTLLVAMSSFSYASSNNATPSVSECTEHSDHDQEVSPNSLWGTIVYLSIKASHYNAHTSYTRTVIRQGKKYTITYKALPKKGCPLCKWNGL